MSHHFPTKSPKRVIIVGGGMAGLATAARLAKKGHQVSLFESGEKLGGKCQTEVINGFAFDTGPSLLTLPAVYRDLFIKTGKRIESILEIKPVDPSFEYIFHDGKRVSFPNLSHNGTVAAVAKAFGDSAGQDWHELLLRAERMWEASREDFIEGELKSLIPFLKRKSLIRDLFTIAPWKTLRGLTESYTDNPYLKKIIDRYATYTGSDPRKAPAVLLTIAFVEEAFGAWHVGGGIGALGSTLATRIRELGVDVQLKTPVKEISIANDSVTGVVLEDESFIPADIVVSNSDASELYGKLIRDNPKIKRVKRNLERATPSLSGFSLLLSLSGRSELKHHTVFFPENYDDEFDAIFHRNEPPSDPAIYVCNPRDPLMVPTPNDEAWFVLVNAPRHLASGDLTKKARGTDWDTPGLKEEYAARVIKSLEDRGVDIRSRLQNLIIRTPADLERDYRAPGGSIYGSSSNGMRSAFWRPRNRSPIRNLYCVGGSAHPGGGLPLVALSAEIVAAAIEEN